MKKLVLLLVIVLSFSTTALAIDIACSTSAGWWPEATAQREMQEIADSVPVSVELFTSGDEPALANWVVAHTGNGQSDLLILCGRFPDSIYPGGNAQPEGSVAELFLDDGNCIINTGDWMFYVSTTNNGADGLANMMDIPGISMGDPIVDVTPTADGQLYTPSFAGFSPSRPWHLDELANDWKAELILGQNTDGTRADPAIVVNTVTGGRLGTFFQVANVLTDERSVVISEWINNWYLEMASTGEKSKKPLPAKEAIDVSRDTDLTWSAGNFAVAHDVYIDTSWAVVDSATAPVSAGQTDTRFDPDHLEFGQTYYWRVDEVNAAPDRTVFKGDVWSFTVEPKAIPVANVTATASSSNANMGPENTVNGSGLDEQDQHSLQSFDMWLASEATPWIQYEFDRAYKLHELHVWNSNQAIESFIGFGVKETTIEYSVDGETWLTLDGPVTLPRAPGQLTYQGDTIPLGDIMAKYVKLTVVSAHGFTPQAGLAEVRFMAIPVWPRESQPADGAITDSVGVQLGWRSGREAVTHDVYLGTDSTDLALVGTVTDNRLDLSSHEMAYATSYFWQVREVNEAEAPTAHDGPIWRFTTPDYGTVDNFDQYDDNCNSLFFFWEDGLGHEGGAGIDDCDVRPYDGNGGGSIVGNAQTPFAEKSIVYLGSAQSMPLGYENALGDSYASLALPGQDWTANGVQTLSLAFRGETGNTGTLYVKINNTKVTYDGLASDIGRAAWQTWTIVLADTGANLTNVTSLTVGVDGANAAGTLFIDDIRLYPKTFAAEGTGIDIALSTQANWFGQAAADREMQEIINNVPGASVDVFTVNDQAALADWVTDHTGNGVANLLILCGQLPDTIYAPGNTQADDSILELFLDDGNAIVNTGDWIFYVVNGAGTNAAGGLQTVMDIPGVTVAGEDNTAVAVTADGQTLTPSLQDLATDRPFHLDTLEGDWFAELILAGNATGTRADPVIVRNSVTGGRIGIFYQTGGQDDDPRGEVISEWINNWYLDVALGGN
jgi:hypothetical protein